MRLRLPFFITFFLSIVCLFFVRFQSFRTFQVWSAAQHVAVPALLLLPPAATYLACLCPHTYDFGAKIKLPCSANVSRVWLQVTWLGLTPMLLAESFSVACWLLMCMPCRPGQRYPLTKARSQAPENISN